MIRSILPLMLLCCAGELKAQETFHSLAELWKYTDEHNIEINSSRTEKEIAAAGIHQAQHNFLPAVSLNGAFTDNVSILPTLVPAELFGGQPGTFVEEQFGKRYNYNAGLNAQVDLINTGNWYALKEARINASAGDLNLVLNRKRIYSATAQAYFTYYVMDQSEKLATAMLHAAEDIQSHADQLFAQGQISQSTWNTAMIQSRAASLSLLVSRQSRRMALNQLKQLLEMSTADSLVLSENLPAALPVEGDEAMLSFSEDAGVKLSRMKMVSAQNSWQASRAAYAPTLSAVYAYSTQVTGNDFMNFDDANRLSQQYWGLRLSVPLLAHGTRAFQTRKTRLDYVSAGERYEHALRQAALDDDNLMNDYHTSRQTLKTSEAILKLYGENDGHAARQLSAGQISLDDRLRIYTDYVAYKNEYLQHLSDYYTRYAEVKVRQQTF